MSQNEDVVLVGKDRAGPWVDENEGLFIHLMNVEVSKGQRQTGNFTKLAWRRIREEMIEETGYAYTLEQLKNKYNQLRTKFNAFTSLLQETGVGWDPESCTVTAPNSVWDRVCMENKHASKFKKRGLSYYEELKQIFGDTAATGAHAHPSTRVPSSSIDSSDMPPPQRLATWKGKKRASLLDQSLNDACTYFFMKRQDMESRGKKVRSSDKGEDELPKAVADAFDALNLLDDLDHESYARATQYFMDNRMACHLFLRMPENRKRDWLRNLKL